MHDGQDHGQDHGQDDGPGHGPDPGHDGGLVGRLDHARPGHRPPPRDPHTGRLLDGRYRVGARIARGGMASVYEALDLRLDRVVAVKIMHAGLPDHLDGARGASEPDDFAARFAREARAAARLSHPNVVAVFDQGEDDGTVFLVMELISGHTLRDVVRTQSPMPPSRALALMEPILSALSAAHRAGLIHRDVKPENVLIADDGRVKVADFGLAKAVGSETQHTGTHGVLIGTVSYLAPELVVDGRADARADVYAAGVMLYELLTGARPHEGDSPIAVAYQHVHRDVPPPSARVPGLPAYVDALVARATARDRALRPADAGVLLHRLHRVGQALGDGVRDDVDLTQDLTPLAAPFAEHAGDHGGRDVDEERWDDLGIGTGIGTGTGGSGIGVAADRAETTALLEVGAGGMGPRGPLAPPDDGPWSGHSVVAPGQPTPLAPEPGAPRGRAPRTPRAPRPARPPRRRRGPVLLAAGLLTATAVGGGAYWFGNARYTTTPGVTDLAQGAAEARLADAGLDVAYADGVYSRTARRGVVVAADPGSGERILPGHTVTLTLSLGPDVAPSVRGLSEDDAQDRLLASQLVFDQTVKRYSEKVPAGTVLTSDPAPGRTLDPGTRVDLVVSRGRRPLRVGDWVGRDVDEATHVLGRRGLVPTVTRAYSDTVPQGRVISQDPTGGTLHKGDSVSLVESEGPELVAVPSVKAYGVDAATQSLQASGFRVRVAHSPEYLGLGFAVSTDPPSGSMAREGSVVTVYVI